MKFLLASILFAPIVVVFAQDSPSSTFSTQPSSSGRPRGHGSPHVGRNHTTGMKFHQCERLTQLEWIVNTANNASELASLPAAEQSRIQSEAANATAQLTKLESNSTFVTQCHLQQDCAKIVRLERLQSILSNATKVQDIESGFGPRHKNVTSADIASLKANITSELNSLLSNSTLVSSCKGLNSSSTVTSAPVGTATGTATGTKSGASG
jgi:hypothetical protein